MQKQEVITYDFEALFKRLYAPLCGFADKIMNDATLAEDIVIEQFIKLCRLKEKYNNVRTAKAFLYTATKNACLTELKSKKHKSRHIKQYVYLSDTQYTNITIGEMTTEELFYQMAIEIELLPEQMKKVLHLILSGMKTDEISLTLNLPNQVIINYKNRALSLLRKKINNNI